MINNKINLALPTEENGEFLLDLECAHLIYAVVKTESDMKFFVDTQIDDFFNYYGVERTLKCFKARCEIIQERAKQKLAY